jgi:O-antigen/teichoic acid export membrane protein
MAFILKSRFQKMLGMQFLGTMMTLLDRYGSVPILTYCWGLSLFGEWLLIRIVPTYLSMFEAGFPSAAGNKIVELIAQKRHQDAINLYTVTSRIMTYISAVMIFGVVLALCLGSPREWLNIQNLTSETTSITILLTALHTVLIFRTQLLYALYRSNHHQIYWNGVIQLTRLGEFSMVVIVALSGGGVIAVAGGIAFARLCGAMYLTFKAKTKIPLLGLSPNDTSLSISKPLLKAGFGFMLMPMVQALNIQGFIWLIGVAISPAMAAIFNIYRIYSRIIFQIGDIIRRALWPELTTSYVHKDMKLFTKLLLNSIISVILIGFIASILSYYGANYIIPHWTLGKVHNNASIIGLLLIVSFLGAVRYVVFTAATAINQHAKLVMIEFFINLSAIIGLYHLGKVNFLTVSITLVVIETLIGIFVFTKTLDIIKKIHF